MRYHILKNPAILVIDSIWPHNWRPSFARNGIGVEISVTILVLTVDYFQEKLMTNLSKSPKDPIWANMSFPGKKHRSVFKYFNYLPLYQKSEKTNMPFLGKC